MRLSRPSAALALVLLLAAGSAIVNSTRSEATAASGGTGVGHAAAPDLGVPALTPNPQVWNLHALDQAVGVSTYNTFNAGAPVGVAATATASLAVRDSVIPLQDGAGISVFVSDAVPSGKQWNPAGSWSFNEYLSCNASRCRFYLRAVVYRIAVNGTATVITTTGETGRLEIDAQTLVTFSGTVAAATLSAGERLGVAFFVRPDEDRNALATLHFDTSGAASKVNAFVTESDAPGQIRNSHYRLAADSTLASPVWLTGVDTPATNFAKEQAVQLRFAVYNDGGASVSWQPRLEWSTASGSGYQTVTGATSPVRLHDTGSYANGASITTAQFGTGTSPGTAVDGVAYDTTNPAPSSSLAGGTYREVAFTVFVDAAAASGTSYYFRLTNNGTALVTYDAGPAQIVVAFPAPPTPAAQPPAHNFHQPYTGDTSACAACHRAHTAPAVTVLYKSWPEEAVCYTCHDGSAAPNIKSQFEKTYRMPITATAGVHSKDEARDRDPLSFRGANRHVECADCHNPHLAGRGNHTVGSNYAFAPQQGVWGVAVTNAAPWSAPSFTPTWPVAFQYQLCFKCHSSWAYGSSPPLSPSGGFPQTDQAKEFNTLNPAYHPVEDVGKNPFVRADGTSYASSLVGGFSPSGRMVCSDCHASPTPTDPAGPHGSTNPFILRGQWDRTTGTPGTQSHVCFVCHSFATYGAGASQDALTGFSTSDGKNLHGVMVGARNKANNDQPIVCMDCHIAIPHGWQRDHLLGFTGDGAPYINRPYQGGLVSIDEWRASGQWTFSSCSTAMNSCK